MIVVNIAGGLGNQLFQYAFGRRVASRLSVPLKLHNAASLNPALRPYRLDRFNISAEPATSADLAAISNRVGWREKLGLIPLHRRRRVIEPDGWFNPFDAALLAVGDDTYLDGYWQSPKYFAGIESDLRQSLGLRHPPGGYSHELAERIEATESVSIHIRRGDYLTRPTAIQKFAQCPLDYYRQAMDLMAERTRSPHFFCFSDDPDWVRDNLRPNHPCVIVTGNAPEDDHLDFWLMSHCRHHIIANSTFSWWGAWLGGKPGQIVIAPRRWFNLSDAENDRDAADRIPAGWIRL